MNNSLNKISVIDSSELSGELYFQSLLEQAHCKGLLGDSDIERLQYECLTLLANKTECYNSGDSSSIQIEKAQSIMSSILFTIGVWLKTYANPDEAVVALQQRSIHELYQKGRKRLDTLIITTKAIHAKLLRQLVNTQNHCYHDTLVDGILGFFKLYNPDFFAQEIHITADYPLFNPRPKLAGIEFIKAYVEAAYRENQFCSYFDFDDLHHLLTGYAEDYQDLFINIYDVALTTVIGCIVADTDCSRLDITETGVRLLEQTFTAKSKNEIETIIRESADELGQRFQFSQELLQYIQNSLPLIVSNIEIAAKKHTLNRVFFTPTYPEHNPQITFSYGLKMEDDLYRKLIAEISQCRYLQDKIAIIKEHVHSMADLEEVLLDADMTSEEMQSILCELSLLEITALCKRYPPLSDQTVRDLREQEQTLRIALEMYIATLPLEQQDLIEQAGKSLLQD